MSAHARNPSFLNLLQIRFPVGAVCSIGHRVSGVVLAVAVPFLVHLLGRSLADADGYAAVSAWLRAPYGRVAAVVLAWALAHHALAGIRHMVKDTDVGATLQSARRSAWAVIIGGAAIALVCAILVA